MTDLHAKPELTTIPVHNPADGSDVGSVSVDTPETVATKARELRLYQPEWEAMSARGRKPWLMKFQNWILDNAEHITDVVQSESGKPRAEASIEAPMAADLLNYFARNAEAFLADRHPRPHNPLMMTKRLTTVWRPYPVVGLIIPWNFPFANAALDGISAMGGAQGLDQERVPVVFDRREFHRMIGVVLAHDVRGCRAAGGQGRVHGAVQISSGDCDFSQHGRGFLGDGTAIGQSDADVLEQAQHEAQLL